MSWEALGDILGQRLVAVVVRESRAFQPERQVFLVMESGASCELYGDLACSTHLGGGGVEALRCDVAASHRVVYEAILGEGGDVGDR